MNPRQPIEPDRAFPTVPRNSAQIIIIKTFSVLYYKDIYALSIVARYASICSAHYNRNYYDDGKAKDILLTRIWLRC